MGSIQARHLMSFLQGIPHWPFGGLPASLRLQVAYCNFQCQRVAWKDPHERLTYCSRWTLCNVCKSETTCNSQLYGCYNVPLDRQYTPFLIVFDRFCSGWYTSKTANKQTSPQSALSGFIPSHSFPILVCTLPIAIVI